MSRSWTIGHDPGCDVVVAHDFVSTRHCRLSQTPSGFLLEDLGSTNGTYVNGERLTAPRAVTQRDSITLGQTVPMPWPSGALSAAPPPLPGSAPSLPAGGRVITVGRTPENDVVLDYPTVSSRHARIVINGGSTVIEDLGSTNGTFVGSLDRRITRSPLSSSDTVFFGTQPIPASRLLGESAGGGAGGTMAVTPEMLASALASPGRPAATVPMPVATPPGLSGGKRPVPPIVLICAGAAGLMLLVAIGIWFSRGSSAANGQAGNGKDRPGQKIDVDDDVPPPDVVPPADDVRSSIYVVLVDSRGDKRQRVLAGIGTATAVSDRKLVTSGGVVTEVHRALAESWDVSVYCPATKKEFRVVRAAVHPEFQAALGRFNAEKGKLDLAMEEMEALRAPPKDDAGAKEGKPGEEPKKPEPPKPARPPPTPEEAKALVQRAMQAEDEMLKSNERMIHFDAGTLEVDGKLPTRVELAGSKPEPRAELRLLGLPKDPKDPETIRSEIRKALQDSGRYTTRDPMIPVTGVTEQDVLMRANPDERALWNWAGAAVLNGENRLVALYSRPTPPLKKDQPPDGRSSDIVHVSRWKDLVGQ